MFYMTLESIGTDISQHSSSRYHKSVACDNYLISLFKQDQINSHTTDKIRNIGFIKKKISEWKKLTYLQHEHFGVLEDWKKRKI